MTIRGYVKQLLALLGAVMGGFVVGIATAIGMVEVPPFGDMPAWVPQAESLGWIAGLGVALSVAAWIYIDYRYVVGMDG